MQPRKVPSWILLMFGILALARGLTSHPRWGTWSILSLASGVILTALFFVSWWHSRRSGVGRTASLHSEARRPPE
jgi:hypothetical protein